MSSYKNLKNLTGKNKGIIKYENGEVVICEWLDNRGFPKPFHSDLSFVQLRILKKNECKTNDVSKEIDFKKVVYNKNDDVSKLQGKSGTVYDLEYGITVIVPDDWN